MRIEPILLIGDYAIYNGETIRIASINGYITDADGREISISEIKKEILDQSEIDAQIEGVVSFAKRSGV